MKRLTGIGDPPNMRRNSLYNTALTVFNAAFSLGSFAYVSRILGPTSLGEVNFASAIVGYFSIIAAFGIPTYGIRAIAVARGHAELLSRTFSEIVVLSFLATLAALSACATAIALMPGILGSKVLYAILATSILTSSLSLDWAYGGLELFRYIALRTVAIRLISFAALLLLVRRASDVLVFAGVTMSSSLIVTITNALGLRGIVKIRLKGLSLRRHIAPALKFLALTATVSVYSYIGSSVLGVRGGASGVGLFTAAFRAVQVLIAILSSASAVAMPRLSSYVSAGQHDAYRGAIETTFRALLFLTVPASVGVAVFASPMILLLSGPAFLGAVSALRIMAPVILVSVFTTAVMNEMLVPQGLEHHVLLSAGAGAIASVALNLLLPRTLGASGAAIAFSVAETVVFGYQCLIVTKRGLWPHGMRVGVYFLASLVAAVGSGSVLVFAGRGISTVVIAATVFLGGYFLTLLLAKERVIGLLLGLARGT